MPAVTIDASVVDGSNTRIYANPIYPVQLPVTVPAELVGAVDSPANINSLSEGDISTANTLPSLPVATTSTPTAITASQIGTEMPPFELNHARILYENLLASSSILITNGANGNFTLIPNTAQRWTFVDGAEIIYTLPANVSIDTVCIGAHNLSGYSVGVQYDTTDSGTFVSFTTGKTPTTNDAMMFHIGTPVSVRRLKILCSGTATASFIGSIYAGIALQMQRPFFGGHTPAVLARQADYYSSMSESGNFIGVEVRRRALESDASWKNLTDTWYRQYFVPFLASAEVLPFYFAWNLKQYPTDVAYCKNITNVAPSYSGQRDLMTVGIPLVGIA